MGNLRYFPDSRLSPTTELRQDQAEILAQISAMLSEISSLRGLILHGSQTRGSAAEDSDVDIISIHEDEQGATAAAQALAPAIQENLDVLASFYTERFSWFGRLWTFYFKGGHRLSVDVGIISLRELQSWFFVEPEAIVLFDPQGVVERRKLQCRRGAIAAKRSRRKGIAFETYHVARKIGRALSRQHLWNAFEYVNIMRRLLFEVFRLDGDHPDYVHVGRQERDIESALPWVVDSFDWQGTIPQYDGSAILEAAINLAQGIEDVMERQGDVDSRGLLVLAVAELRELRDTVDEV